MKETLGLGLGAAPPCSIRFSKFFPLLEYWKAF